MYIMENSSGRVTSTLQTRHSSASSFPVVTGKEWLLFIQLSWSFSVWSMKTNIRAVGFSQKPSIVSSTSEIFSSEKNKNKLKILKTWSLQRGPRALSSQALVGMGRGHRNVSLLTSLRNFSSTLIISQNTLLSFPSLHEDRILESSHTVFLGYWGFSDMENLEVEELQLQIFN